MVKTKIACPCGMETHLVMLDGKWHYDVDKHGNGELAEGCFNCRAPLKTEDEPAEGPVVTDRGQPKALSDMTKSLKTAKTSSRKPAKTSSRKPAKTSSLKPEIPGQS